MSSGLAAASSYPTGQERKGEALGHNGLPTYGKEILGFDSDSASKQTCSKNGLKINSISNERNRSQGVETDSQTAWGEN